MSNRCQSAAVRWFCVGAVLGGFAVYLLLLFWNGGVG